jgi:predicted DNA-binding transcriptional regulator AlpA
MVNPAISLDASAVIESGMRPSGRTDQPDAPYYGDAPRSAKSRAVAETLVSMKHIHVCEREAPDRLLSLSEVSERCGLAVTTLLQMRARGDGPPSFRLGARVRVKESDLQAWIAEAEAAEQARRAAYREENTNGA